MATFGTFTAGQVLTADELNTAGAWNTYTPSWTQSATITKTTNWARYTQLGKWVQGSIKMTASSNGTTANKIVVGLPVAASSNNFIVGSGFHLMTTFNPDGLRPLFALYESSTTMSFFLSATTNIDFSLRYGQSTVSSVAADVLSGDIFYVQFAYEAA